MPTAELRTGAQKNDVFRTVNGVNFKIGPFDRLKGGEETPVVQEPLLNITPACYPRIILRDTLGYELDTYTTLQEAIYKAKWNVQTTGQAKTPIEWRLPKAPVPARPDLTRKFPTLKHPQLSTGHRKAHAFSSNVLEIDVDDVSFVRESLDNLPHVPSLSFLRQELVAPKTYFQIVGTMLLHKKLLSETEKRQAIYKFPGFCSGCIRMGLCYGCDRSSEPHYHEDKPVKTGGGFTYYKKDRPEREMKNKNPINWKINHPDQVLKKLMEDYAGVHLEGDIAEKIKDHLDEHGGERRLNVSEDDGLYKDRRKKHDTRGDDGRFLPDINVSFNRNGHPHGSDSRNMVTPGKSLRSGHSGDVSIDPSDVDIEMYETENGRLKPKSDLVGGGSVGEATDQSGHLQTEGDQWNRDGSRGRYNDFERYEHRLPKYRKTETDGEMDEDEGKKDYDGDDESRGRKRDRLYKPPAPFKLKKSPKRRIESMSPFSTERSYDIRKGRDFVPKKSNKLPTEFVDFRNVDVSWKEPKKFELKNGSHKPTKFWTGPRNKKKDNSRSRSPKHRRHHRPPRSPSPDSGLDTGFVTENANAKAKPQVIRIVNESKNGHGKREKRSKATIKKPKQQEIKCTSPGYLNPLDDLRDTAAEFYKLSASDDEIINNGSLKRSLIGRLPKGTTLNGSHSNEVKGVETNNDDNGNYSAEEYGQTRKEKKPRNISKSSEKTRKNSNDKNNHIKSNDASTDIRRRKTNGRRPENERDEPTFQSGLLSRLSNEKIYFPRISTPIYSSKLSSSRHRSPTLDQTNDDNLCLPNINRNNPLPIGSFQITQKNQDHLPLIKSRTRNIQKKKELDLDKLSCNEDRKRKMNLPNTDKNESEFSRSNGKYVVDNNSFNSPFSNRKRENYNNAGLKRKSYERKLKHQYQQFDDISLNNVSGLEMRPDSKKELTNCNYKVKSRSDCNNAQVNVSGPTIPINTLNKRLPYFDAETIKRENSLNSQYETFENSEPGEINPNRIASIGTRDVSACTGTRNNKHASSSNDTNNIDEKKNLRGKYDTIHVKSDSSDLYRKGNNDHVGGRKTLSKQNGSLTNFQTDRKGIDIARTSNDRKYLDPKKDLRRQYETVRVKIYSSDQNMNGDSANGGDVKTLNQPKGSFKPFETDRNGIDIAYARHQRNENIPYSHHHYELKASNPTHLDEMEAFDKTHNNQNEINHFDKREMKILYNIHNDSKDASVNDSPDTISQIKEVDEQQSIENCQLNKLKNGNRKQSKTRKVKDDLRSTSIECKKQDHHFVRNSSLQNVTQISCESEEGDFRKTFTDSIPHAQSHVSSANSFLTCSNETVDTFYVNTNIHDPRNFDLHSEDNSENISLQSDKPAFENKQLESHEFEHLTNKNTKKAKVHLLTKSSDNGHVDSGIFGSSGISNSSLIGDNPALIKPSRMSTIESIERNSPFGQECSRMELNSMTRLTPITQLHNRPTVQPIKSVSNDKINITYANVSSEFENEHNTRTHYAPDSLEHKEISCSFSLSSDKDVMGEMFTNKPDGNSAFGNKLLMVNDHKNEAYWPTENEIRIQNVSRGRRRPKLIERPKHKMHSRSLPPEILNEKYALDMDTDHINKQFKSDSCEDDTDSQDFMKSKKKSLDIVRSRLNFDHCDRPDNNYVESTIDTGKRNMSKEHVGLMNTYDDNDPYNSGSRNNNNASQDNMAHYVKSNRMMRPRRYRNNRQNNNRITYNFDTDGQDNYVESEDGMERQEYRKKVESMRKDNDSQKDSNADDKESVCEDENNINSEGDIDSKRYRKADVRRKTKSMWNDNDFEKGSNASDDEEICCEDDNDVDSEDESYINSEDDMDRERLLKPDLRRKERNIWNDNDFKKESFAHDDVELFCDDENDGDSENKSDSESGDESDGDGEDESDGDSEDESDGDSEEDMDREILRKVDLKSKVEGMWTYNDFENDSYVRDDVELFCEYGNDDESEDENDIDSEEEIGREQFRKMDVRREERSIWKDNDFEKDSNAVVEESFCEGGDVNQPFQHRHLEQIGDGYKVDKHFNVDDAECKADNEFNNINKLQIVQRSFGNACDRTSDVNPTDEFFRETSFNMRQNEMSDEDLDGRKYDSAERRRHNLTGPDVDRQHSEEETDCMLYMTNDEYVVTNPDNPNKYMVKNMNNKYNEKERFGEEWKKNKPLKSEIISNRTLKNSSSASYLSKIPDRHVDRNESIILDTDRTVNVRTHYSSKDDSRASDSLKNEQVSGINFQNILISKHSGGSSNTDAYSQTISDDQKTPTEKRLVQHKHRRGYTDSRDRRNEVSHVDRESEENESDVPNDDNQNWIQNGRSQDKNEWNNAGDEFMDGNSSESDKYMNEGMLRSGDGYENYKPMTRSVKSNEKLPDNMRVRYDELNKTDANHRQGNAYLAVGKLRPGDRYEINKPMMRSVRSNDKKSDNIGIRYDEVNMHHQSRRHSDEDTVGEHMHKYNMGRNRIEESDENSAESLDDAEVDDFKNRNSETGVKHVGNRPRAVDSEPNHARLHSSDVDSYPKGLFYHNNTKEERGNNGPCPNQDGLNYRKIRKGNVDFGKNTVEMPEQSREFDQDPRMQLADAPYRDKRINLDTTSKGMKGKRGNRHESNIIESKDGVRTNTAGDWNSEQNFDDDDFNKLNEPSVSGIYDTSYGVKGNGDIQPKRYMNSPKSKEEFRTNGAGKWDSDQNTYDDDVYKRNDPSVSGKYDTRKRMKNKKQSNGRRGDYSPSDCLENTYKNADIANVNFQNSAVLSQKDRPVNIPYVESDEGNTLKKQESRRRKHKHKKYNVELGQTPDDKKHDREDVVGIGNTKSDTDVVARRGRHKYKVKRPDQKAQPHVRAVDDASDTNENYDGQVHDTEVRDHPTIQVREFTSNVGESNGNSDQFMCRDSKEYPDQQITISKDTAKNNNEESEMHLKSGLSRNVRNISVNMSNLSPHLHMDDSNSSVASDDDERSSNMARNQHYVNEHEGTVSNVEHRSSDTKPFLIAVNPLETGNIKHRGSKESSDDSSPPHVSIDVEFENKSLTSQEPDLDLEFEDAIDVANLEIQEPDNQKEVDKLQHREERRRRRHRHEKKRRRNGRPGKETNDNGNKPDNDSTTIDNDINSDITGNSKENYYENENLGDKLSQNRSFDRNCVGNEDGVLVIPEDDKECIYDDERPGQEESDTGNKPESDDDVFFRAVQMIDNETKQHINSGRKDDKKQKKRTGKNGPQYSEMEKGHETIHARGMPSNTKMPKEIKGLPEDASDGDISESENIQSFIQQPELSRTFSGIEREDDELAKRQLLTRGPSYEYNVGLNGDMSRNMNRTYKRGSMSKKTEVEQEDRRESSKDEGMSRESKHNREINSEKENKVRKEIKLIDTKRKGRRNRKTNDYSEIDLSKLPSLQTQIAKIMGNYSYDGRANTQRSSSKSSGSYRQLSAASGVTARRGMYRSISELNGCRVNRSRSSTRSKVREERSTSLPLEADLLSMKEHWELDDVRDLDNTSMAPVYLDAFPMGVKKKQFKSTSVRKRVPGRERSLSIGFVGEDGTNKSELEPLREETQVIEPQEPQEPKVMERVLTPSLTRIPTPASTNSLLSNNNLSNNNSSHSNRITNPLSTVGEGHIQKLQDDGSRLFNTSLHAIQDEKPKTPVKREIVKKEKKVKTPLPPRPKLITPEPREPTPVSPEPIEYEEPVSREISFDFVRELPDLPPIEVPDLPDIPELQPTEYKGIKREKKLIEVTPELTEQKRKLPPPPKSRPQIRSRAPSRKQKVAEAPVTTQELQQMQDPLDFLAKYCIINPDRLPFYERVFNGALSVQTPRYSRATEAPKGAIVHLPPAQLSDHELNMLKDITVLNQGHCPRNDGISGPEQYLEKLNYSIEFIKTKQDVIQSHMEKIQAEKMRFMAGMATKWDRDIVRLDYKTKSKKKKKKKKKKKGDDVDYDQMGALTVDKINFQPMKSSDITDEVIVSRMDDKMMKKIKKDPSYLKYKMEIGRDIEKLKHYDQRVAQVEDEKDLVGLYCMDYYFSEQGATSRPHEFRRQQSRLYQKLHPDTDIEMNIEEVEPALQQINNKLLTEREFQYIYFILDLPKREKINFRLFSIVAALSEKVTQMDPVIRKLINKVDYNALDVKMEKSKELFQLLQDERVLPKGNAPSDNLAVELTAGGLTPEHTNYVMNKFDRDGRGFIDFLDFVTYVPLFIEIHRRIIEDPFNETLCI